MHAIPTMYTNEQFFSASRWLISLSAVKPELEQGWRSMQGLDYWLMSFNNLLIANFG